MSHSGWIFMGLFWGIIIVVNVFCYKRILEHRHKHGRE